MDRQLVFKRFIPPCGRPNPTVPLSALDLTVPILVRVRPVSSLLDGTDSKDMLHLFQRSMS